MTRLAIVAHEMRGAGHYMMAASIRRGLERAGMKVDVRLFGGKPLGFKDPGLIDLHVVERAKLCDVLNGYEPNLVLVDHFWAPVQEQLMELIVPVWLLVRMAPQWWLDGSPRKRLDRTMYDRIIAVEPTEATGFTHHIDPIVICNPDDMEPTSALWDRLGTERPAGDVHGIVHAGFPGEARRFIEEQPGGVTNVVLSPDGYAPIFPAAPYFGAFDMLLGGAGYGFVWETVWLGVSGKTRYRAFERGALEPMSVRMKAAGTYRFSENGADTLARMMGRYL